MGAHDGGQTEGGKATSTSQTFPHEERKQTDSKEQTDFNIRSRVSKLMDHQIYF